MKARNAHPGRKVIQKATGVRATITAVHERPTVRIDPASGPASRLAHVSELRIDRAAEANFQVELRPAPNGQTVMTNRSATLLMVTFTDGQPARTLGVGDTLTFGYPTEEVRPLHVELEWGDGAQPPGETTLTVSAADVEAAVAGDQAELIEAAEDLLRVWDEGRYVLNRNAWDRLRRALGQVVEPEILNIEWVEAAADVLREIPVSPLPPSLRSALRRLGMLLPPELRPEWMGW